MPISQTKKVKLSCGKITTVKEAMSEYKIANNIKIKNGKSAKLSLNTAYKRLRTKGATWQKVLSPVKVNVPKVRQATSWNLKAHPLVDNPDPKLYENLGLRTGKRSGFI